MTPGRLFVCSTCSRYSPPPYGQPTPGQTLYAACKRAAAEAQSDVVVRAVECLNGCPHPCMAALSTPGKTRLRLCRLRPEDAPALIAAAALHAERDQLDAAGLPEPLRHKIAGKPIAPVAA